MRVGIIQQQAQCVGCRWLSTLAQSFGRARANFCIFIQGSAGERVERSGIAQSCQRHGNAEALRGIGGSERMQEHGMSRLGGEFVQGGRCAEADIAIAIRQQLDQPTRGARIAYLPQRCGRLGSDKPIVVGQQVEERSYRVCILELSEGTGTIPPDNRVGVVQRTDEVAEVTLAWLLRNELGCVGPNGAIAVTQ